MDTPIELLTQALLGELPEERKRCFEAWLQESEEHRLLWERFRQQGYFENTLSELHAVDAEGAFREFLRNRKRIRIRRVIKYAAVLLPFAFLLGWAARQTFRINETVNLPAEEQIAHGKIKAQLFLSNGTKCDLGENDCLLNEGQVNVVASGGKLQYENKAGELEEEVKYNVLVVPRGGEYTLALSDGTVVNLNSESELKYPVLFTGDTRTVRVSGEAYFEVAEDAAHPFIGSKDQGIGYRIQCHGLSRRCGICCDLGTWKGRYTDRPATIGIAARRTICLSIGNPSGNRPASRCHSIYQLERRNPEF